MSYTATDQRLHLLCQTLAKLNRSFVPARDDDSHTNLYFDELDSRITGHWIETSQGALLCSLNLGTYSFEWQNEAKEVVHSYAVEGKGTDALEAEIESDLNAMGLERAAFRAPLHFDIPIYDFREDPIKRPSKGHLKNWMQVRAFANQASQLVLGHAQVETSIRIWPHHFDTGIYFQLSNKTGIGFGFAMQDASSEVPYFYIAAYPDQGKISYSEVPELNEGCWTIDETGFTGAILPMKDSLEDLKKAFPEYLKTALHWLLQQNKAL